MEDIMANYIRASAATHPVYNKPAGLITADDVAARLSADIAGKTILITGCGPNSLGSYLAWTIAHHAPACLVLCGRASIRLRQLAAAIGQRNPAVEVRTEVFDLGDLGQVRATAERVNAKGAVDVVICNAGIMLHPLKRTVDGIEPHLGVNSTGHFVLVNMLLPAMIANGGGRVVTTSSGAYLFYGMRWDDPNYELRPDEYGNGALAYSSSKTADILFSAALARRHGSKGIVATSVDLGGAALDTHLGAHMSESDLEPYLGVPIRTKPEACSSQMIGAFDPAVKDCNGSVLLFCAGTEPAADHAKGEENETRFWELSEKLAKQEFK